MGAGWGGSIYSNICECRLSGAMHPIRIELCGRPVLIILWIAHFGHPFYMLRCNLGLLLRQDLAERVYKRSG